LDSVNLVDLGMLGGWNSFKYQNIEKWWLWSKWWLSCGRTLTGSGEGREGTDTISLSRD
jgi:hypothetical protein